jgi:basic membrane protein A
MKKKLLSLLAISAITVTLFAGCGSSGTKTTDQGTSTEKEFKVAMVTDTGGVNDQSFNQSSWEGLQSFEKNNKGAKVSYLESKQESDYATNLDKSVDGGNKLVWGIGFAMADAILNSAKSNPDVNYAIVDNAYDSTPANVTGVMFKAQEPSFMVGYIAGKTTKTNKVGFVGGITSGIIDQFQYGYQAGVAYAAKELGKDISVDVQYAESFSDASKGKAIAQKMFSSGCDIVFHAAGGAGVGVIEAAKEANKFAIGVDRDQAYLAPDNVLTSALKLANVAVENLSKEAMSGNKIGGQTFTYGLKENAVGIPTENKNMDTEVYKAAMAIEDKIKDGTIVPPYNKETFDAFGK